MSTLDILQFDQFASVDDNAMEWVSHIVINRTPITPISLRDLPSKYIFEPINVSIFGRDG